jgi:CysZ protein
MINDVSDTIKAYFSAFSYARRYGLFRYLWLSGFLSLLIGGGIFLLAYSLSDDIGSFLSAWWSWDWGSDIILTITNVLSGLLIGVIGLFLYKYIVLIIIGPIMSPLSERLEEGILGISDGESLSVSRMVKEMIRGASLALRNLVRELFFTILLLAGSLIPVLALATTPMIYFVQSYYLGFGNMDYFLERHFGIQDSIDFVRKFRWVAITNGALFILTLFIPILGLFLAPFLCTIASTVVCVERCKANYNVIEDSYV